MIHSSTAFTLVGALLSTCCGGLNALSAVEFERHEFPMTMRTNMALAVDIDNDQDVDIVAISQTRIVGIQMPERSEHILFDAIDGGLIHADHADMDNDGDQDVIICRFFNPWLQKAKDGSSTQPAGPNFTIAWLENTGTVTDSWPLHIVDNEVHGTHGVAVGDLNNDNTPDIVAANVSGAFPRSVTWYPSGQGRQFIHEKNAGGRPHYVAIGDLNNDGRNDVALGSGNGWSVYLADGDNWARHELLKHRGGTNLTLADCDNDGDLDVIGGTGHGDGIFWFENPSWQQHTIRADITDVHSLSSGDFNGDGLADIVANSNRSQETLVYLQGANSTFQEMVIDSGNRQQSYGCCVADVDGDGKLDIVLGGRKSNNVIWYQQK